MQDRTYLINRWLPTALVVAAGICLSLLIYGYSRHSDDDRVRGILTLDAEWRAQSFQRRLSEAMQPLESLATLVAAQENIDARQFTRFVELGHDADDFIAGINWAPWVENKDRAAFTANARVLSEPDFEIFQTRGDGSRFTAPEQPAYLPMLFGKIFENSANRIGFDLLTDSSGEKWALVARDTGVPTATPPVHFSANPESPLRFLAYWPVYTTDSPPDTIEARRIAFRGVAVARFRFDEILPGFLTDTQEIAQSIDFSIDDGKNAAPVYVANFDTLQHKLSVTSPVAARGEELIERDFTALGRRWTLAFHFGPETVVSLRSYGPEAWLMVGILLTVIISILLERERGRRMVGEKLVEDRTSELAHELQERQQAEMATRRSEQLINAVF